MASTSILLVGIGAWLHTSVDNRHIMLAVHARPQLEPWAWDLMTQWGDAGVVLMLLLFVLRRKPAGVSLALKSWLLGGVVSQLFKRWWNTPRPTAVLDVSLLDLIGYPPAFGHSMPSGHALAAGSALAIVLMAASRMHVGLKLFLLGLSLLIAWSRVAVGAHWPADVLVGWGLGGWVVWAASIWERHQPWDAWIESLPGHGLLAGLCLCLLAYLLWWPVDTDVARGVTWVGAGMAVYCMTLHLQVIRRVQAW